MSIQIGFSQALKSGEKAEAFINNVWKEVKILKPVAGKPNMYEVETIGVVNTNRQGISKATLQVSSVNLRTVKTTAVATTASAATAEIPKTVDPHLGKYDLYSGIPSMYIGHLVLLTGGKYKVALSTDETNYEFGNYTFDVSTNTIEWQNGLFKNNNWKGKLINTSGNNFRIEFGKVTYAESN
jgi:hypothetical protein